MLGLIDYPPENVLRGDVGLRLLTGSPRGLDSSLAGPATNLER